MGNKNIWEKFNFSDSGEESAYDLLQKQADNLGKATKGELEMDIEAIDSYLNEGTKLLPVAVYTLYVVAPHLGNFRRKILTVVEGKHEGRFPVDILCNIDNNKEELPTSKEDFFEKVAEILSRPLVKNAIESLYKQSKANTNRKIS